MKRKIRYLIWGCSLAITALAAIQSYFIYNTYILKEKEAQSVVRLELIRMENLINIDSVRNGWFVHGNALLRAQGITAAESFFSSGAPVLSRKVAQYINTNPILHQYRTVYQVVINKVLLESPSGQRVTLTDRPWFGSGELHGEQLVIHDLTTDNNISGGLVRNFTSRSGFAINGGENSILREMLGLLIFSVLLLGVVILLFYLSIRSLVTQKKISDMQTDFINNITHEFNTPLATLGVALSTVKDRLAGQPDPILDNSVATIDRQQQRLRKLIGQVISHTAGPQQLRLHRELIHMPAFIAEMLEDFKLGSPQIELMAELDSQVAAIKADRFHLTTAIVNILDNAVKYGGGQIIVTTVADTDSYGITIKDNGIGITGSDQARIFEKFYRAEKGDIHNTKGLGLGLYYSELVITAHGGKILLQSGTGQGSTFTLILPR
ncbi:MAG: HAMP domain-containing sensor histidine kinase [Mucilaginibacter sp.]|uniref:sensor histidine kinase n=1 Tax=Mucilaginibacter sp. TaxID=1882438 RepID=UPI003266FBAF